MQTRPVTQSTLCTFIYTYLLHLNVVYKIIIYHQWLKLSNRNNPANKLRPSLKEW